MFQKKLFSTSNVREIDQTTDSRSCLYSTPRGSLRHLYEQHVLSPLHVTTAWPLPACASTTSVPGEEVPRSPLHPGGCPRAHSSPRALQPSRRSLTGSLRAAISRQYAPSVSRIPTRVRHNISWEIPGKCALGKNLN